MLDDMRSYPDIDAALNKLDTKKALELLLAKPDTPKKQDVVYDLLQMGLGARLKSERQRIRRWVKQGREIPEGTPPHLVAAEMEWGDRLIELERDHSKKLSAALSKIVDGYTTSLLAQWKLDNGQSLGDATVEYVNTLARHHRVTASGQIQTAAFYDRITEGLNPSDIIRDHVTPAQAEFYRRDIFGETAA